MIFIDHTYLGRYGIECFRLRYLPLLLLFNLLLSLNT